jgi:hypothetical protein
MKVQFIKTTDQWFAGEVVDLSEDEAAKNIKAKEAKVFEETPAAKPKD